MKKPETCPKFEATLTLIGKRWTGLIIRVLLSGNRRFLEIKDVILNLATGC
ncbi:winged helix-turn-helix transcriptional regulator [Thermoactinomyces mirandus]|uniref:winged helix-turn-helix transcriptional regulator n=1 Tax=Thermoactinomyces mirandus TaxID=2756294 RepID=UPI0028AE2DD9|nr:winged helix-turn-helix transcriptional regulator [Thermoactinomyces mirandus]